MLSSGLREECLAARSLLPAVPCGLVTRRPSASDLAFCIRHGLSSIHPDHRQLTALRLRDVLASGLPLLPYTVDDPADAFRLIDGAGAVGVFSTGRRPREAWPRRPSLGDACSPSWLAAGSLPPALLAPFGKHAPCGRLVLGCDRFAAGDADGVKTYRLAGTFFPSARYRYR